MAKGSQDISTQDQAAEVVPVYHLKAHPRPAPVQQAVGVLCSRPSQAELPFLQSSLRLEAADWGGGPCGRAVYSNITYRVIRSFTGASKTENALTV